MSGLSPNAHSGAILIVVAVDKVLENANKVTKEQITEFLNICREKYLRAKIEPGEKCRHRHETAPLTSRIHCRCCRRAVDR